MSSMQWAMNERWTVLLACWIMAFGCLRYTHITRSEPRRLTQAFLHCHCLKGKQKHNRDGFDYVVPACFSNGFFWAKEVLEACRTLAPARQRAAGLCFSDEGRPWTILEVQESLQAEMSTVVGNVEETTTYSWRRVAPTVAQLMECRPEEMSALVLVIGKTRARPKTSELWPSITALRNMQHR